jgi:hypothetical protein
MRYADFRKLGMFTGSGAIEGGTKAIVVQRAQTGTLTLNYQRHRGHHRPAHPARQRPLG